MNIRTSQEIIQDMEDADNGLACTDGSHYEVKWVAVEDIRNSLQNMRNQTEEVTRFELLDTIIDALSKNSSEL